MCKKYCAHSSQKIKLNIKIGLTQSIFEVGALVAMKGERNCNFSSNQLARLVGFLRALPLGAVAKLGEKSRSCPSAEGARILGGSGGENVENWSPEMAFPAI